MNRENETVNAIDSSSMEKIGENIQREVIKLYSKYEDHKTEKLRGDYGKWKETHEVATKLIKLQEVFGKPNGYKSSEAEKLINEINNSQQKPLLDLPTGSNKKLNDRQVQELTRIVSSHYDVITSKMTEISKTMKYDMQQLDTLSALFQHQRSEVETILSNMRNS